MIKTQTEILDSIEVNSIKPTSDGLKIVCSGYSTNSGIQQGIRLSNAHHFNVMVSGSTYSHRDILKGLGLHWDPEKKVWNGTIDREELKQIESLHDCRLCVIPRNDTEIHEEPKTDITPAPEQTLISTPPTPTELEPVDKVDPKDSVCSEKFICANHDWLCQNCDLEEYRDPKYATQYISTVEAAEKLLHSDYYLYRLDGARRIDQLHGCIHTLFVNGRTIDEIKTIIRESQQSAWAILAKNWTEGLEHSRRCVFDDFPYGKNDKGIQGQETEIATTMKITDNVKTWIGHARDEYDLLVEYHKRIGKFPPEELKWLVVLENRMKGEFLATVNQPL